MGSLTESHGNHALVFGASGITGWGVVNAILEDYPTADAFSQVTALTNRPLAPDVAQWPSSAKLNVVSGLDLLRSTSQEELEAEMKEKIKDVNRVTHVYFFAYIMDPDPDKEIAINVDLLRRAVLAVEHLSPHLQFVTLPIGTKVYGVHLISDFPFADSLPLSESLPRIPEPHASQMFYYNQLDLLTALSADKSWTFCTVIPDVVIGFVPNNNVYCLAQTLALYLSLVRAREGSGAAVAFPGTPASWRNLCNDSSQELTARFAVYASLHPEVAGAGQSFNVADNARPSSWSVKWPVICDYFGLKGVGPDAGSGPDPFHYVLDHRDEWMALEKRHGLQSGRVGNDRSYGGFPQFIMTMFNFDRQMDLTKMHKAWGRATEERDAKGTWWPVFDRFRKAKIIP